MKLRRAAWAGISAAALLAVGGGATAVYLVPSSDAPASPSEAVQVAQVASAQQVVPVRQQVLAASAQSAKAPAGVQAKSAFLFDVGKNKILWSRSADTKLAIGSMTKVMTALVVLQDRGGLDRKITIKKGYTDRVTSQGGSTAHLRVGDKITARELLYGMMLPSGCDAAAALADAYGPGYNGFITKMNQKAAQLGLNNTHYDNFDGLAWTPDGQRWNKVLGWSTARDQVTLARYAMRYAAFRSIAGARSHTVAANADHNNYNWLTTNHMLGAYPQATGIKTGHTDYAGYCLLFSAARKNRNLVGVVLNSTNSNPETRFSDARKMLDWALGLKTFYSVDKAAQGLPSD